MVWFGNTDGLEVFMVEFCQKMVKKFSWIFIFSEYFENSLDIPFTGCYTDNGFDV